MLKNWVCAAIGILGAAISKAFGGWDSALTTLVIFMGIDYVTGLVVAGVFHNSKKSDSGGLESGYCLRGLLRKGVMLLVVLVAWRLDLLVGTTYMRDAAVIAFCSNELLSVVENAGLMGVPMPKNIVDAIDILKKGVDGE